MSAVASSSAVLPISGFPAGVDVHWETQRQVVWNEQEHTHEEHEMVYEISWIKEFGLLPTVAPQGEKLKSSSLSAIQLASPPVTLTIG
jgi:hypothetical protein